MEKPKRDKRKNGGYRPIVRIIGWTLILLCPLLCMLGWGGITVVF